MKCKLEISKNGDFKTIGFFNFEFVVPILKEMVASDENQFNGIKNFKNISLIRVDGYLSIKMEYRGTDSGIVITTYNTFMSFMEMFFLERNKYKIACKKNIEKYRLYTRIIGSINKLNTEKIKKYVFYICGSRLDRYCVLKSEPQTVFHSYGKTCYSFLNSKKFQEDHNIKGESIISIKDDKCYFFFGYRFEGYGNYFWRTYGEHIKSVIYGCKDLEPIIDKIEQQVFSKIKTYSPGDIEYARKLMMLHENHIIVENITLI